MTQITDSDTSCRNKQQSRVHEHVGILCPHRCSCKWGKQSTLWASKLALKTDAFVAPHLLNPNSTTECQKKGVDRCIETSHCKSREALWNVCKCGVLWQFSIETSVCMSMNIQHVFFHWDFHRSLRFLAVIRDPRHGTSPVDATNRSWGAKWRNRGYLMNILLVLNAGNEGILHNH